MGDKCILVTGGAGYIGSHTVIECLEAGYTCVVVDNLVNASAGIRPRKNGVVEPSELGRVIPECLDRVQEITGKKVVFYEVDLCNMEKLGQVFEKHKFTSVVHFAGLKAVGESCDLPLLYYRNNLIGTMNLLELMKKYGVYNIVFSSSATVYGDPQKLPLDENHPAGACTNPYGKTKYFIEQMLEDICKADQKWNAIILRYFNPVGSHSSGRIGEDPQGPPNNLMPYVAQVAVGRRAELSVFGSDYDTPDGTGVRDYIHVVDLAVGHLAALNKLNENCGLKVYNLGTGIGYSVLDMVKAFEKATGKQIPYKIVERRAGDIASCYADPKLAEKELGWKAKRGLEEMCADLWKWQSMNPKGFNVNQELGKGV